MTLPSLNFTQDDALAALRSFLIGVLPQNIEVVTGQSNRVPEPVGPDFVIMTPLLRERLETNVHVYADCAFNASIGANGTLSVTSMIHGSIQLGNTLFGVGIPSGIVIASAVTGSGGVGDYALSGSIGSVGSEVMASGVAFFLNPTEFTVQCDVYGPSSADHAQVISTLFRDQFAVDQFAMFGSAPPGYQYIPPGGTVPEKFTAIAPLYCEDPRQMPFVSGEEAYELRWIVDCCLQCNFVVEAQRDFAGAVRIYPLVPVDNFYPA
jgi:hypothetical protein